MNVNPELAVRFLNELGLNSRQLHAVNFNNVVLETLLDVRKRLSVLESKTTENDSNTVETLVKDIKAKYSDEEVEYALQEMANVLYNQLGVDLTNLLAAVLNKKDD